MARGALTRATDPSRSDPVADGALVDYAAWALANEPTALDERFAFDRMVAAGGLTDDKRRYVLTVLQTTSPLIGAYRRQRPAWVPPARSARRRPTPAP